MPIMNIVRLRKEKNEQICQKSRAYLTEYTSFWSDFSKFCEKNLLEWLF